MPLSADEIAARHNKEVARGSNSAPQLRSFIERVERLEEEKKALSEDIKSVYDEAGGNGFDKPAIREIVRRRKKDPDKVKEHEAIVETYMVALGMI